MTASIDDSGWPIVVLRWSGRATDDDLAQMLAAIDRLLDRGRFGLLLDTRGAQGMSQDQRRTVIKFMRANDPRASRNLIQAVVHDSALQRALYIAISAVAPLPGVSSTFADPELARQWLLEKLAAG